MEKQQFDLSKKFCVDNPVCVKYNVYMNKKLNRLNERPELEKSEIVKGMPKVCSDETAAVEFFELQSHIRWALSYLYFGDSNFPDTVDFKNNSCEMIAETLEQELESRFKLDVNFVEVWEDGENGARLEFS